MKNEKGAGKKIIGSLTKLTVKEAEKVVGGTRRARERAKKANG